MSDLETAALDIRGARKALCSFVGPKTVIIGHGYVKRDFDKVTCADVVATASKMTFER
jgi:hypothetical protein